MERPAVCSEASSDYQPPPLLDKGFASIYNHPPDEKGQLVWAVKNMDVKSVRQKLEQWPQGANLIDTEGNTLFHVIASEARAVEEHPEAVKELMQLLLKDGWSVVDMKNQKGERADVVASHEAPTGLAKKLFQSRSQDFVEQMRIEKPLLLIRDLTPVPWAWQYLVEDDQRRCYAGVLKSAFPADKCNEWMNDTLAKSNWVSLPGVARKVAWFVSEEFADCPYKYSGLEYPATVFPQFMLDIRQEVCAACGIPPEDYPNSCNVNVYDDHSREVGWHADDEVMFQGLAGDTRIVSFSLGVPRDFSWRLQGTTQTVGSVPLGDGDIMTMEGLFQKHYKHSVPVSDKACGRRANFTFRWIRVKAHAVDSTVKGVA